MFKRILLVQDEEISRAALGDHLRKFGYTVDCASNGKIGLDKARSLAFDLMIFDLPLPGRDSIALCRHVRSVGLQAPILMITACHEASAKVAGLKAGADDCVTKPFDMRELSTRVEALLRRPISRRSTISSTNQGQNYTEPTVDSTLGANQGRRLKSTSFAGIVPQLRKMLQDEQERVQTSRNRALLSAAQGVIEFLEDILHDVRLRRGQRLQ